VRIGVGLASYGEGVWEGRTAREARLAEELGFDDLWVPEHLLFPTPLREPIVSAGVAVGATERIGIIFGLLQAAMRHPVSLAKALTSLAAEAEGRIVVGLGVGGDYAPEWAAVEVPTSERGARFDELLGPLLRMLRGEPVIHQGRFYRFEVPALVPAPEHLVPVFIGALSKVALQRAALVDGYMSAYAAPDRFARAGEALRAEADRLGRPAPELAASIFGAILGEEVEAHERMVRHMVINYGIAPSTAERGIVVGLGNVVDAIARYTKAGATRINVTLAEPPEETWPILAEALLPTVAR
jgi:alkanesulfonate monooxygenase SsuD/methylene tetrahydromethanopterin reductase-like flavin-dependent oxidoreductase (luciferase family)